MIDFAKRRLQSRCWHHWPGTQNMQAISWIESMIIECGARKMFWCVKCKKTWYSA